MVLALTISLGPSALGLKSSYQSAKAQRRVSSTVVLPRRFLSVPWVTPKCVVARREEPHHLTEACTMSLRERC